MILLAFTITLTLISSIVVVAQDVAIAIFLSVAIVALTSSTTEDMIPTTAIT